MPQLRTRLSIACFFAVALLCSPGTAVEGQGIARPAPNKILQEQDETTTAIRDSDPVSFSKAMRARGLLGDGSLDHRYRGFWIGVGAASAYTVLKLLTCGSGERRCDRDRIAFADGPPLAISLALAGAIYGSTLPKQLPADSTLP